MDVKGRISVPTRYRAPLSEDGSSEVVCTIDLQNPCLLLYPMSEWESVEKSLKRLSDMIPSEKMFKRRILGNAADCEIDKNGRFLIPSHLREHAGLNKQVMLVGQLNKFEIWDQNAWHEQMQRDAEIIESQTFEVTERLQDFSL